MALVVLEGILVSLQLVFDHHSPAWLFTFYAIEALFVGDIWVKAHVGTLARMQAHA